jgi:hypothetical protein
MVYTDDSAAGVRILVSRKKWAKAKRPLATLHELLLALEWVDHELLKIIRGFLVYVDRTYKPLTPFLMGHPWCWYRGCRHPWCRRGGHFLCCLVEFIYLRPFGRHRFENFR